MAGKQIIKYPKVTKKVGYEHYIPPKVNAKTTKVGSAPNNGRGGWAPDYPSSLPERYAKPKGADDLPAWFKKIRAGSEFMPAKIKPVSYNYMSLVETPNRAGLYGTGATAASADGMTMGVGHYNRPTEDVTKGIKTAYNLTRDQQALGQKPPSRIMGMFMRAVDVLSRPLYSVMNVHLQNVKTNYMTPESAGGSKVTFGEHIQAILHDVTPWGIADDLAKGHMDDRLAAGWRGLSGKDKTLTHTVLEQEYPGFTQEHKYLALASGFIGDVAFDPLTWITLGATGPGTVLKSLGAGGLGAVGKTSAAKRLLEETLLTSTGRKAAVETLRADRFAAEMRKAGRQTRSIDKQLAKIGQGKATKLSAADLNARKADLAHKLATARVEDLKGAEFAWKVIKSGAPTLGIDTLSKMNLGASHWRRVKATKDAVELAHGAMIASTVNDLRDKEGWHSAWVAMHRNGKPVDITYEHAGRKFTVELSKTKKFEEWLDMIVSEAAPIAEIAEHTTKAARSRKARIVAVEARSHDFRTEFFKQAEDRYGAAMGPDAAKHFDQIRSSKQVTHNPYVSKVLAKDADELKNTQILNVNEEVLHDRPYAEIKQAAQKLWRDKHPDGPNQPKHAPRDIQIIIHGTDGEARLVSLSALNRAADAHASDRAATLAAAAKLKARTPAGVAADARLKASEAALTARERAIAAFNKLKGDAEAAGQQYVSAVGKTEAARQVMKDLYLASDEQVQHIYSSLLDAVKNAAGVDTATRAKIVSILNDESLPLEERIKRVLNDTDINNQEFVEITKDFAQIEMHNGQLSVSLKGEGSGIDMIKNIMNEVFKDRLGARVGLGNDPAPMLAKAGLRLVTDSKGMVKLEHIEQEMGDLTANFLQDIHGELGMMALDAYRHALNYAQQMDLLKDPEILFNTMHEGLTEFLNTASADVKRQVFQLMLNVHGIRVPENFVPTFADLDNLFPMDTPFSHGPPSIVFLDKNKNPVDQHWPWNNLAQNMQRWATNVFPWIKANPMLNEHGVHVNNTGLDMHEFVLRLSMQDDIDQAFMRLGEDASFEGLEQVDEAIAARTFALHDMMEQVEKLRDKIRFAPINDNLLAVNRYSMADFLMYGKEIIESQQTTLRVANTADGRVINRINAGRLSALDSFSFVDSETIEGIKALEEIKKLAQDTELTYVSASARHFITTLFEEDNGIETLYRLAMPASGSLSDIYFKPFFETLGIHAMLKQDVVAKTTGARTASMGTKHRADLMDHLWGVQSLHNEWQKALHNRIMHNFIVEGMTQEQIAIQIADNLERFFENYERVKRLLHPVRDGNYLRDLSTTSRKVQANWGGTGFNRFNVEKGFKTEPPGKYVEHGTTSGIVKEIPPSTKKVRQPKPGGKGAPVSNEQMQQLVRLLEGTVTSASAMNDESAARKAFMEKRLEAQVAENRIPVAPEVAAADPNVNPQTAADFANTSPTAPAYTPEDLDRIREWIKTTYAGAPPQKVAHEMHALSMSMANDLAIAQGQIISGLSDLAITHGASLRIMGVPLMNMPNPMNATHAVAAVTVLAQDQSFARKFFRRLMDPTMAEGWKRELLLNVRKRSHVLSQGLDRINSSYANAASILRKELVPYLNNLYVHTIMKSQEFNDPAFRALSPEKRVLAINKQLFDPAISNMPGKFDAFEMTDGSNPVKEIVDIFNDMSSDIYNSGRVLDLEGQLKLFNRYMTKKYKLTPGEIEAITDPKNGLLHLDPYSIDWINAVGNMLSSSALGKDKLKDINLGEFQYAMHDAVLKRQAGDALHNGVFDTFASKMERKHVDFINNKVIPHTVDSKGNQMRGRLINIFDLTKAEGLKYGIDDKYIPAKFRTGEYYISEDMLPEIKVLFDYMDEVHQMNDTINAQFLNKVLNYFKSSVTIYNIPTYPVRNLISDVFLGAMDGLTNPRYYKDAAAILAGQRKEMKEMDLNSFQGILDRDYMGGEVFRATRDPASVMDPNVNPNKPVRVVLQTEHGKVELNDAQIMHVYEQLGLGQNRVSGDIPASVAAARRNAVSRSAGKANDALRTLNDVREDWSRLSHFLYALEREGPLGGSFEDVIRRAGDRVIKYHFDYADVSLWERKTLARWIPFYKWVRNVIPFTLAHVVLKPKFLSIERAASGLAVTGARALENETGDQEGGEDFIVADFIRNDIPVPMGTWSDPNGYKFQQFGLMYLPLTDTFSNTLANPLDPLVNPNLGAGERVQASIAGGVTTAATMMNPVFKAGMQAVSGQVLYPSGPKPEGPEDSFLKTLGQLIPGWAATETGVRTAKPFFAQGEEGKNKYAQLMQMLGGLRIYNNSESVQKGQLKQTEQLQRGALNKRKAEIAAFIHKQYPNVTDAEAMLLVDAYLKQTRKSDVKRL